MTDLPINSSPPAAPAIRKATASTPTRAPFAPEDVAQADPNAFQDALALVLATGVNDPSALSISAAVTASKTGKGAKSDDSTALMLDATATTAPAVFALPPATTLPSALPPVLSPTGAAVARTLTTAGTANDVLAPVADTRASSKPATDLATPGQFSPVNEKDLQAELAFANVLAQHSKPEPEAGLAPSVAGPVIEHSRAAPTQIAPVQAGTVEARVGERGWDQGVGDKLVWMTNQKHQVAELSLNPPDLGPLKITITLDQNQASAQFNSAHASVRDAIESAMPRLREMLADSGITLGNASVGTDAFREPAQQQQRTQSTPAVTAVTDPAFVTIGERVLHRSRGQVDTFA